MQTLRCSSLDSLFACTPSILLDNPAFVRVGSDNEAAVIGRVIHSLAQEYVIKGSFKIREACAAAGVDNDDAVTNMMLYVMKVVIEIAQYMPSPQTEASVQSAPIHVNGEEYILSGTLDLLSIVSTNRYVFADYKTGFIDDSYTHQMAGYAYCLWCMAGHPEDFEATAFVAFLRHNYYRVVKFTTAMIRQWEGDLTRNVLTNKTTFKPGKVCQHCTLYASCPARAQVISGTIGSLLDGSNPDIGLLASITEQSKLDPAVGLLVDDILARYHLLKRLVDDAYEALRVAVQCVGPIPLSGDQQLYIKTLEIKSIVPKNAIPALRKVLGDGEIAEAMKLSLPKLALALSEKRDNGVAKSRKYLETMLDKANAIVVSTQERLQTGPIQTGDEDAKP